MRAAGKTYDVTTKQELLNALKDISTFSSGDKADIRIHGTIDAGILKNGDGNIMAPTLRNIRFTGVDDESGNRAELRMEMQLPQGTTAETGFSLHFQNLRICQTQGEWGNSKHLISFKDNEKHHIDTLEFVNCELTELCRSLFRGEDQDEETSAGTIGFFHIENCRIHNGCRQTNALPLLYFSQPVKKMVFTNNTFYDLTYLNSIVTFGKIKAEDMYGMYFSFSNNTVSAWSRKELFDITYVAAYSEFHIKNNFFLFPDWADDKNNRYGDTKDSHDSMEDSDSGLENGILKESEIAERIATGAELTYIKSGFVQLENNILCGYRYQPKQDKERGINDILSVGDKIEEEAAFSSMTMTEAGFAWSDFAKADEGAFTILTSHSVYTAGKDGDCIGDKNNYISAAPEIVNLTVNVTGGYGVYAEITPAKKTLFAGDKVTITLHDHNNALCTPNKFLGWKEDKSMDKTRVIELKEDLTLTAEYEAAIPNMVSFFNFSVTPDEGKNQLTHYDADIYAEGHRASATAEYVPVEKDSESDILLTGDYTVVTGGENIFNWRDGKFGEDDADKQVAVLSRKTPDLQIQAGTPTALVFTFSTKGLSGIRFSAYCGTDLYGYKTQAAEYSTDNGKTWKRTATVDLEQRAATFTAGDKEETGTLWGWTQIKASLPKSADDKEKVLVRIVGDATGETVRNGTSAASELTDMTEYVAAVLIEHSVPAEVNYFTVTFLDKDGNPIGEAQTVEEGSAAVAPEAPEQEGFFFTGWDRAFDNVTEDMTVTAQYIDLSKEEDVLYVTVSETTMTVRYDNLIKTRTETYEPEDIPASVKEAAVRVVIDESVSQVAVTTVSGLFAQMYKLEEVEGLENINTTELTDVSYMFRDCKSLAKIDLNGFDLSGVSAAYGMFQGCTNLTTILCDANYTALAGITSLGMFDGCTSLTGGKGTKYSTAHKDASYARPDEGESAPGYFTGEDKPTGVNDAQEDKAQCTKVLRDGVLYIQREGKTYNAQGATVK